MADYLILGGGLAGCVLASRIKEYQPSATVVLVEAGPDEHNNPLITEPMGISQLYNSVYNYKYKTAPQKHCDNREIFYASGRVLSGSTSVNYAAWTRGDRAEYDSWAKLVNEPRWSYDGQLPYFRKTESHHFSSGALQSAQHGSNGPIHTAPALSREYPLTKSVREAYLKIGVKPNDDPNSGDNKGIAPYTESWRNGKRQPAGKAYGLKGVQVMTNAVVKRILLEEGPNGKKVAVGAELNSGQIIKASNEVILCCGAFRTPQVLMLSGIGPRDELEKHGIQQTVDAPEVGKNLHDHSTITQFYRVRDPEKGLCALSPAFNDPTYLNGFPTDYIITESAPVDDLKKALIADGEVVNGQHPHIYPPRSHYEILPMYAPAEIPMMNLNIPLDGSIMSIGLLNLLPTSRGTITLKSADPADDPIIDPNYFATHVDRAIIRAALRRNLSAFETPEGQAIVVEDVAPPDYPPVTSNSTDDELDTRVRRAAACFHHGAGSAAMGKVVDTECRLFGVEGLRVVDASVIPCPLTAHLQVPIYALAEQMAEIIANKK